MTVTSTATLDLDDAARLLRETAELMETHDIAIRQISAGEIEALFRFGELQMSLTGDRLNLVATGPDEACVNGVKAEFGGSLNHIAGRQIALPWQGGESTPTISPKFCKLQVTAVHQLTPHVRRIRFTGEDLDRYGSPANLHVKLLIPPRGAEMSWPLIGSNGQLIWPEGPSRPTLRKYTVRAIDPAAGHLDIDFVIHEEPGPGADFAMRAQPGDMIGMVGPGGLGYREADWYLLIGDETAVPAIARLLAAMPDTAKGTVLIELADVADCQELGEPAGVEVKWLQRRSEDAEDEMPALAREAMAISLPGGDSRRFVWAGVEFDVLKAIRPHFQRTIGLSKREMLLVAYWRKGQSEEQKERQSREGP